MDVIRSKGAEIEQGREDLMRREIEATS